LTNTIRIFGVDPGTATTGYGVVDSLGNDAYKYIASGIIQTKKDLNTGERLKQIRQDMLELIQEYKPSVLVVESIFFFKNAKTVIPVAQAKGVILEAAASFNLATFEYTPMQVKLNLTGFGKSEKKVVQHIVAQLLNHSEIIRPDDAADAIAIAICHARMSLSSYLVSKNIISV
jgi:crossover junction endodeoxyribonuclease RuvC